MLRPSLVSALSTSLETSLLSCALAAFGLAAAGAFFGEAAFFVFLAAGFLAAAAFGFFGEAGFLAAAFFGAAFSPATFNLKDPEAPLPFVWIKSPLVTAAFKYFLMNGANFSASTL